MLVNFRDLKGIKNKEGKTIIANKIYRGPALRIKDLSEEDKKMIDDLGFKHIVDFRGLDEIKHQGELYYPKNANYHHLPAIVKNDRNKTDDLNTLGEDAKKIIEEWLIDVYKDLPFDNDAYRFIINAIKNDETPIYFHCSAGKDRTGVMAAIILLLLNVDEEEIYKDYLLSYDNYVAFNKLNGRELKDIPRPSLCFKEWLEGSIETIKDKYSSIEEFFEKEYNLSEEDIINIRKRHTK